MATVTAIAKTNTLEQKRLSAAIRTAWSKTIVFEALIKDHMANIPYLTSSINPGGDRKVEQGKMIMDVTPTGMEKFARKVVLQKILALQGAGLYGDNVENQPGNEENVRAKYFTAYAADWSHAICGDNYGFNYRDQKEQEIFDKSKGLLAQWWGETDGLFMRHAYTQSVSPNLLAQSAIASEIEAHYNDNIYICGAYQASDTFITARDYHDYTDYETAVLAALALATEDSKLDVRKLMDIAEQCADSGITPVKWEGYELYQMSVHPDDMTHLVDPSVDGSFGKNWIAAAA
ncbi:MAG: hypothetical protein MIO92_14410, partial [Methanosarcinaceae archaeon]|nr:hypothetical protein [Methanosarcinaceae archaeon]